MSKPHYETSVRRGDIIPRQTLDINTSRSQKKVPDIRKYFQTMIKINEEKNLPAREPNKLIQCETKPEISESCDSIRGLRVSGSPDDKPPGPNTIDKFSSPPPIQNNPPRIPQLLSLQRRVEPNPVPKTLHPYSPLDPPLQPADGSPPETEKERISKATKKIKEAKINLPELPPEGESIELVPQVGCEGQLSHNDLIRRASHLHLTSHHDNKSFSEKNKTNNIEGRNIVPQKNKNLDQKLTKANEARASGPHPATRGAKPKFNTNGKSEITKYFLRKNILPENQRKNRSGQHSELKNCTKLGQETAIDVAHKETSVQYISETKIIVTKEEEGGSKEW